MEVQVRPVQSSLRQNSCCTTHSTHTRYKRQLRLLPNHLRDTLSSHTNMAAMGAVVLLALAAVCQGENITKSFCKLIL